MKKLAFCACLLMIGGIGTMGTNACSNSSSTSGSSSGSGEDASNDVGSSSGTDASSSSSGSGSSSGTSSSGSGSGSSSGAETGPGCQAGPDSGAAFTCGTTDAGIPIPNPDVTNPADGGSDTSCNNCLEGCCGDSWCACAADTGLSDAGTFTGCLGIIGCTQECIATNDAGMTPTQCFQQCAQLYPNSATNAQTLFTCIASSCGTTATCGQ